tara:strand:- start:968 stop:1804 length:837 start_codon:yes stop_codon:yes gene_type:complete
MGVISLNAEAKLINLASSIGRSPQSWHGWYCLRIAIDHLDENIQHECLFWVRSLIESYLNGIKNHIYFCENSAIHIIANSVPHDIWEHAAQQICDLTYSESSANISYKLYDLSKDGRVYAQEILDIKNGIFNFITSASKSSNYLNEAISLNEIAQPNMNSIKINDKNAKVLLVEDDPVTRWLVRQTLKDNCDLLTAQAANKVFSIYASYQPDVVFLDINLPDKNGYDVLEWIMRNDPGANVVMFSSQNDMDSITNALDMGATGFIGKPFIKNQLLSYI